ncbi:3-hydroxyacyl-CoA dehydrogenase NAD-binding domain-containing protein [Pseudomonas sp. zfem002]|uniref:3-hydroxyacyl-CoA dehydrogenase NAD-binding domain-containing protein n=1 Tax=Pseudomonas sp. zfem002 TaxID=3078197 RepID=UPI0029291C99|nr:3-hydroxyacyl-CoA dehydrogenase NAD-binding domain-containing protein [Pseudomonas sp. zfem002]MDU9394183.1 3-hydroxyacyl-CoA dehydrogenase NAD-binding domain-containing protein [Pseudomonas sp. zfem002]
MYSLIHYSRDNELALIGLHQAPVNALGHALRRELAEACRQAAADPAVKALVLHGQDLPFSAGADIGEFGSDFTWAEPSLPALLEQLESLDKPVVAAIAGVALGGGLELAMACGYRVAEASAQLGLPEILLGLIPGAGGTQRLPRLVGAEQALQLILSGQRLGAGKAHELGLVDRLADNRDDLLERACAFARELLADAAPARPAWPHAEPAAGLDDHYFDAYAARQVSRWHGQVAPQLALAAVQSAGQLPLAAGLALEQELFQQALASAQSAALRHLFFAEREALKIPGVTRDTALRPIGKVAVIGAGTMGGGIAMNFVNAGIPVVLLELKREALDRGLAQIRKNYEISVQRGKLDEVQLQQRMALFCTTLDYADLADADLVIEAVFENLEIKQQVFRTLDEVCKPGAILASNTSTLDVDRIAAVTRRPQDVIGLHFFSPANVMRLLEIVRGAATAPDALATTLQLARKIGKIPVVSGVCFGFIGNRMLEPYAREAHRLVLEGASPAQVDRVLTNLGLAMGVFAMYDLAGIDVGYLVRESRRAAIAHDPSYCKLADALYERGRYGQKSGSGFYRYAGRERLEDGEVIALAEQLAGTLGIQRRVISDQEIHDRCLFMLINEGIQLLDEGIALRSADIDLVWVNGYGFPAWRGGPLYYAEQLGLQRVLSGIRNYRETLGVYGETWLRPAPLLERLVAAGHQRIERC